MSRTYFKPSTFLERLDRLPPNICRLIARTTTRPIRPLTINEIADRAGMPWQKAQWIARQTSWRDVPVGLADQFRHACGITCRNEWRHLYFLIRSRTRNKKPLAFLDNLNETTVKHFHRIRFHKRLAKLLQ